MKGFSVRLDNQRVDLGFLLVVALSLIIGIFAGSQIPLSQKMMFYIIVLTNTMLMAYLFLLRNMTYGLILYFYALIFLNIYWRITLPGKLPDLDVPRLVFIFFWIVFLMEIGLGNRRLLPRTNAELAMIAVVGAIILSMIQYRVPRIRLLLNGFAIPYAMFIVAKNIVVSWKDLKKILYIAAVPLSFYFPTNHIFESLGMRQFVFPRYIMDPEVQSASRFFGERTVGAFLQPVATGFAIVCMFHLSLYALSKLKGFLPKAMSVFLCGLTPIAIFVIYTRSVYLGFFNSLLVLAIFGKRLRKYAIIMLAGAVLVVLANWDSVTTEDRASGGLATRDSAVGRLVLLEASLRMFMDYPFRGVGFDQYHVHRLPYVRQVRTTLLGTRDPWIGKNVKQHNQFLLLLTELGLMGFVPLVLVYYFIIRMLFRARKIHSDTYDYEFVVVVSAIFTEYLTNVMFMNPSYFEFLNVMPMFLTGIVVGGYQRATLGGWNNNGSLERRLAGEGTIR